jgi:glucokinase
MSGPITVGVDLGGTGTRIVALDVGGVVVRQRSSPTPSSPGGAVAGLIGSIRAAGPGLGAVGIGASGPVDALGIIRNTETLPAFSGIQLAPAISERLGVPCVMDNDAAAAAIGEYAYGAGRGSTGLLVITLGTGIGVAALTAGRPFRGADGAHPEAGHMPVCGPAAPCYCGLPACWEQLASRTALDQLADLAGQPADALAGRARGGDAAAARVFGTYGERVGAGLVTLLAIFRPDRVVVAGGAARFLDLFGPGLHRSLDQGPKYSPKPAVVAAELGDLSGAIGAAVLARSSLISPYGYPATVRHPREQPPHSQPLHQ